MTWTRLEGWLLRRQLVRILPDPGMEQAVREGLPALLGAMPLWQGLGLRLATWAVTLIGPLVGGLGPMERSSSWVLREVATLFKVVACLLWERAGCHRAHGWGEGAPVQVEGLSQDVL